MTSIVAFDEWFGIPTQETCPRDVLAGNKGRSFAHFPSRVAMATGTAIPLIHHMALAGFKGVKIEYVKKLGGLGVRVGLHFA